MSNCFYMLLSKLVPRSHCAWPWERSHCFDAGVTVSSKLFGFSTRLFVSEYSRSLRSLSGIIIVSFHSPWNNLGVHSLLIMSIDVWKDGA